MLARLGLSTPITTTTPVDEDIITADALLEACTSHWRKMASSSPLYKIDMRDYFRRCESEISTPLHIGTKPFFCIKKWRSFSVFSRTASGSLHVCICRGFDVMVESTSRAIFTSKSFLVFVKKHRIQGKSPKSGKKRPFWPNYALVDVTAPCPLHRFLLGGMEPHQHGCPPYIVDPP